MTELIVALDVETLREEEEMLKRLKDTVTFYKIGLQLFTAHGPRAVSLAKRYGGRVFLDLKLHDIAATVALAVQSAQSLDVESVSIHLSGGPEMLRAAAAVHPRPKLWGVSILTSLSIEDLAPFKPGTDLKTLVTNLALQGQSAGVDGIVCSAQEAQSLREAMKGRALPLITPGIRPANSDKNDQKRVMTPGEAAKLGIEHIVVGRPITHAKDPLKAAQDIFAEMQHAAPHAIEKGDRR